MLFIKKFISILYSYLRASAGNILAAFQDGKILAKIDKEIEVKII